MAASTLPGWEPSGTEVEQWTAFIVAHALAIASLGSLLLLIAWTGVKRPLVVVIMILSFMLNSICNLMVINSIHGPVSMSLALVGYVFCLCGTTIIACTAFSTTAFVWAMLQRSFGRRVPFSKHFDLILLVFPWVMYFADMIYAFAWDPGHKGELEMALLGGYSYGQPTVISHFVVAGVILASLALDIWATVLVVKNRRIARQTSIIGASENSQLNFPFITRVLLFGLANAGGLVTAVLCYATPDAHAPAIYQACCGFGLFLLFGTQADLYVAAKHKLCPPPDVKPASVPLTPRIPRTPAFPSHIGRLSTFWVSATTHGGVRRSALDSDLESLQVPDLLREGDDATPSGPLSADSMALETPKASLGWDYKDGGPVGAHPVDDTHEGPETREPLTEKVEDDGDRKSSPI